MGFGSFGGGGGGGGGGAPTDAEYVVMAANATLTAERVLTAGDNISLETIVPGIATVSFTAAPTIPSWIVDVDSNEAILVRADGDAGDVLVVDTNNEEVLVGRHGGAADEVLGGIINMQRPGSNITGSGWQTVASFTLPGGLLQLGNAIALQFFIRQTSGSGGATLRIRYGGSTVATSGSGGLSFGGFGWLFANGATNAQRGVIGPGMVDARYGIGSAAVDSTADQTLAVELDLNTDTNIFVCDYICFRVWPGT